MPGQYEEIKDWYNAIIDKADKAQSRVDIGLGDNKAVKVAAVNAVLSQALIELWGGAVLPEETAAAVKAISEKMVDEGVNSFKRKGEGEELRKLKKAPDRFLRSIGLRTGPESPSDFFKHQYRDAKAKGITAVSAADESRSRSASTISDHGEVHDKAGSALRNIFADNSGLDEEVDFTSKKPGARPPLSLPPSPPRFVSPEKAGSPTLSSLVSSITEVKAERLSDWRDNLSPLDQRDKKAAASLGAVFAGKGDGPKLDFPKDLPGLGVETPIIGVPGKKRGFSKG